MADEQPILAQDLVDKAAELLKLVQSTDKAQAFRDTTLDLPNNNA